MSIILGLNCNHADSSACIIKDGKLLFAIEEERLNRIKHWAGIPVESIKQCLIQTNTKISDIEHITLNTDPRSNFLKKGFFFFNNYLIGKKKYEIFYRLKKKLNILEDINKKFSPNKLSPDVKIHYIDHHISHISSAFYPSGFKKAVGLSIDGFGDFVSISIAECDRKNVKIIKKIFFPNSLGVFYEAFTQLIGFKNYGDEYKFMGLSSYGKPIYSDLIKKNIFKDFKKLTLNLKYFNHTNKNYVYKFEGKPKQNRIFNKNILKLLSLRNNDEIDKNFRLKANIASSVQKVFEDKLINICKEIKKLNYSSNLVYAGGCALNSLANKKIIESKLFKNLYIPYSPGDGGGSIGSALYFANKNNYKISNLKSPFIGTNYSIEEIENYILKEKKLRKFNVIYEKNLKKLHHKIAKLIYKNKIVGFFQGKMEFGPRALGNRSILANPCEKNIKDIINLKIKRRENFRPFAPSILDIKKKQWFETDFYNSYMSSVENVLIKKRRIIPSVTHIDGTGRVQAVSKKLNPNFYSLIYQFYKISGAPLLLNTSFNENEPIVNKPKEAIECFLRTKMDVLVLENFIIIR